jgi:hypothetical protein
MGMDSQTGRIIKGKSRKERVLLSIEEHQDERQDKTDEDTGGQGKIKGEVLPLEPEISGKTADERDLIAEKHQETDGGSDRADDDQHFSELGKQVHSDQLFKRAETPAKGLKIH